VEQDKGQADDAEQDGYGVQESIEEKCDHRDVRCGVTETVPVQPPDMKSPGGLDPRAMVSFW